MDSAELTTHIRRDLDAFAECLTQDLAVPIAHCGNWTLLDLAQHLGTENLWAAAAITQRRGDYVAEPGDPAALQGWFRATAATLLDALGRDPDEPAWTLFPPRTVAFWQRRRALETAVHLWDARHALRSDRPIDNALAGEGIDEVFDTIAPRQHHLGRSAPPDQAMELVATDTCGRWRYGPGAPVATVQGRASDLYLLLWGRMSLRSLGITVAGDPGAVLLAGLTP